MRSPRQGMLLAALLAPALASCVALLDFDELSEGSGGAANVSGSSNGGSEAGGSSDEGGAAGSAQGAAAGSSQGGAPECGDCTDDDPCTVDSCAVVDGEATCQHEYTPGLALDGIDETIAADVHHRVTMIGGPDAFFYSVFSEDNGEGDVAIYRLGATDDASELVATLSDLPAMDLPGAGRAVSAAGLAIDDAVAFRLHAFVGIENAVGGARPWHVIFQGDPLEAGTPLPVGDSYDPLNPISHPVALNITGTVYGAWITETHTIELSGLGAANTTFGASTMDATTLSLFDTTDNEPAVLYTGSGNGVYLESVAASQTITECETRPGFFLSAQTVPTGIQGFHFASWTKAGDDFLVNQSQIVACSADGCFADPNCDGGSETPIRNTAGVTAKLPGAPPGEVHYALAVPYLAPGTDPDAVDAGLSLQLFRINFGPDPLVGSPTFAELGEALDVARLPTDTSFSGPNYPAIAYVEPDKLALAWLQPGDSADELHVQRYQMCLDQ
ncbi:MAG TPA: hypothetical protein VM686_07525 [Polyangiaceae bacterium]|nr:hypothetical protein [Polyangiaceae bacterium]